MEEKNGMLDKELQKLKLEKEEAIIEVRVTLESVAAIIFLLLEWNDRDFNHRLVQHDFPLSIPSVDALRNSH